jgi:hypothetical protein
MAGFAALAQLHRVPLLLHWEATDACQAVFGDLFSSKSWDGLELIDSATFRRLQAEAPAAAHRSYEPFDRIWSALGQELCTVQVFLALAARYLRSLQPLPEIADQVHQIAERLSLASCVGIHVRMTDNIQAYEEWARTSPSFNRSRISTRSGFLALVRLLDEQGQNMFLSTDNLDIRREIGGLSQRVASHEAHYDDRGYKLHVDWHYRGNPLSARIKWRIHRMFGRPVPTTWRTTSVADALIDMLLLGRCQRVVGTYWSSFGQVAAMRGNVHFSCMEGERVVPDATANALLSASSPAIGNASQA